MKKTIFFTLFICLQIFFIFWHIYQESNYIQLSYQNQKQEQKIKELKTKKEKLTQKLLAHQDPMQIKEFAQTKLAMKKVKLDQIRAFNDC